MSTKVDEILNYKKNENEDFYAILGCDEHSTLEQINQEYKVRALQYHPDKNDGDKEAEAKFQLLNQAKETLTNPEMKAMYDKWRNSGISMSYKQYLGMKEHVQQSMHWTKPQTKDRMLESAGGIHSSGLSSLGSRAMGASSAASAAQRRASEGGANLHCSSGRRVGGWGDAAAGGGTDASRSEIIHVTKPVITLNETALTRRQCLTRSYVDIVRLNLFNHI